MPFINLQGRNILFVHIPKTGGTSVEEWLGGLGTLKFKTIASMPALRCTPQHLRQSDLEHLLGSSFFDYVFTIVRDPYERIASEYRMRASMQKRGFFGESQEFSLWIENILSQAKRDQWALDNHLRPQWEFIGDNIDVFRFEEGLDSIIRKVASKIGAPAPASAPRRYGTQHLGLDIDWTVTDRRRVADFYKMDFERFSYDC